MITTESLEEIRRSETEADLQGEDKILKILGEVRSIVYRDLRRKTRMKSDHLVACLKSLKKQGKICVSDIENPRGPPTRIITIVPVIDNSPDAIAKRKASMLSVWYLKHGTRMSTPFTILY